MRRVKRRPPKTRNELLDELVRLRFPEAHTARFTLQERLEDELDKNESESPSRKGVEWLGIA